MAKKVAVVTDTSSGLDFETAKLNHVHLIPLNVMIDGKEYEELKEITTDEFLMYQQERKKTSTSLPSPVGVYEMFNRLLETHDQVLYIPISSKLSGTYISGCTLAREFDGKVVVADALRIVSPLKWVAIDAKRMLDQGMDIEEVKRKIESTTDRDRIYILTETLEYLKRGGRISPAVATVGNLLKIKPVLLLQNGEIGLHSKVRTITKAVHNVVEGLEESLSQRPNGKIIVLHYQYDDVANGVISILKEKFPNNEILVESLGAVILNHTGPKTLGIGVYFPLDLD